MARTGAEVVGVLRQMMRQRGWSIGDLARHLDADAAEIGQAMSGQALPTAAMQRAAETFQREDKIDV